MNILLTSDWQLSANPRDKYRLDFLPWLLERVRSRIIDDLYILGDLTEEKDGHPGWLVNTIVGCLSEIAKETTITIIPGNHDGMNPKEPFFQFLNSIPKCSIFLSPHYLGDKLFLPFTKNPAKEWESSLSRKPRLIFAHQEFKGAKLTGKKTSEANTPVPNNPFLILSGHIHTPHEFNLGKGKIVYVGSPYPVDFGDDFMGGIIHLDLNNKFPEKSEYERVPYKQAPKRSVIHLDHKMLGKPPSSLKLWSFLKKGDQIKIKANLNPESLNSKWPEFKKEILEKCSSLGIEVLGMETIVENIIDTQGDEEKEKLGQGTPLEILEKYCMAENIDPDSELGGMGKEIVKEVPVPEAEDEE